MVGFALEEVHLVRNNVSAVFPRLIDDEEVLEPDKDLTGHLEVEMAVLGVGRAASSRLTRILLKEVRMCERTWHLER